MFFIDGSRSAYTGNGMNSLKTFWPWFRDLGLIIIGSLAQAVGLRLFLIPANLASGGISGISQLVNYFTSGFIRLVCDSCQHEIAVAFSCKRRGFCPSCCAKRRAV